jgi:hypothetical protein
VLAADRQDGYMDPDNIENWVARLIAFGLALIGVTLLAVYPLNRAAATRERADIARAAAPLLSVPLDLLQAPGGRTFDLAVPNDEQWNRIGARLGYPSFLLVAASARGESRAHMFPPQSVGLVPRVWRNGAEVAVLATSDTPDGNHVRTAVNGYSFSGSPGDRLRISARIRLAPVPSGAVLLLAPRWTTSSASAWAEGAAISSVIRNFLSLASLLAGAVFVWWALTIAWGRPETICRRRRPVRSRAAEKQNPLTH